MDCKIKVKQAHKTKKYHKTTKAQKTNLNEIK